METHRKKISCRAPSATDATADTHATAAADATAAAAGLVTVRHFYTLGHMLFSYDSMPDALCSILHACLYKLLI